MIAFEYTEGWRVILPLLGTLTGALGTVALTQWSERKRDVARRAHELALRELEAQETRHGRFYERRIDAYNEVRRHILARRRLGSYLWISRAAWESTKVRGVEDSPEGQEAKDAYDATLAEYQQVTAALELSLVSLYTVATGPVRTEVENVELALTEQVQASLQLFELADDAERYKETYDKQREAEARGHDAEQRLQEAISAELRLDE